MNQNVPTGSNAETVQRYFDYLYSHYLDGITQQFYIHWDTLAWVGLWIFILVVALFA
jgi:hypothetical protein